jgi:hypothetical protein
MQQTHPGTIILIVSAATLAAITGVAAVQQSPTVTPDLPAMIARFAPADIGADTSGLSAGDRRALQKLVEAARVMDSLFLRQVWAGNDAMLQRLAREAVMAASGTGSPASQRLQYFLINKGPW